MTYAPIALFVYNRPQYLIAVLNSLKDNSESKESTLFVFCDGPKSDASAIELKLINETRNLVKSQQWCKEVQVFEKATNLGLANSIISGVTEIVNKYGSIIVLEDDLVISRSFLNYMNTALNLYQQYDKVISIVGYNYPVQMNSEISETFFLRNADCWGWATWKRGWDLFQIDPNILIKKIKDSNLIYDFNFNNQYPFFKMLKGVALGKVNSWAIRWYASAYINNKLTLFPKKSLVKHIGNDGTHFSNSNDDLAGKEICHDFVSKYEMNIIENNIDRDLIVKHFNKYNRRRPSYFTLKYFIKRFLDLSFIKRKLKLIKNEN